MPRRYVVKFVTSSPGWTGTVWAYGCKHLASAEVLFERKEVEVGAGDGLLLIDRQERIILRAKGSADPVRTANSAIVNDATILAGTTPLMAWRRRRSSEA